MHSSLHQLKTIHVHWECTLSAPRRPFHTHPSLDRNRHDHPLRSLCLAASSSSQPQPQPQPINHDSINTSAWEEWSEDTRTAVTASMVRRFLASANNNNSDDANTTWSNYSSKKKTPATQRPTKTNYYTKHTPATTTSDPTIERGLQFQVVTHLMTGNFDEAFLSTIPIHTLNWSIKTLGKKSRLDLAEHLFHWMRVQKVGNEHTFVKLCEACEAQRAPTRAVMAWRNVRRLPTHYRLEERASAALLKTFRPTRNLTGAMRILQELIATPKYKLNQYAFNVVIRMAADEGDVDTAMAVVEQLRNHPTSTPDVRTFSALLSALMTSDRWSRVPVVHKMITECNVAPDPTLFLQLLAGYAGAGRPEAAEAVMDAMVDAGMRPTRTHWNALLSSYAQARRYEGCVSAYKRMVVTGLRPDAYSVVALLHGAAGVLGGVGAATFVLSIMQRYEIQLNVEVATALIACCRRPPPVASEQKRAVEFARNVMGMLIGEGYRPNIRTFNSLLAVQRDAEDWYGVKRTMGALEKTVEVEPDEATWNIALGAYQSAGWFDKCEEIEELRDTWRLLHSGVGVGRGSGGGSR